MFKGQFVAGYWITIADIFIPGVDIQTGKQKEIYLSLWKILTKAFNRGIDQNTRRKRWQIIDLSNQYNHILNIILLVRNNPLQWVFIIILEFL